MSLEPNFVLPDESVSILETTRREEILTWFVETVRDSVSALLVTGSMSYGANYSVRETSDIDVQILVTKDTVQALMELGIFDESTLMRAIAGYTKGLYDQFSLDVMKDGVKVECHFWGAEAFIYAITYKTSAAKRLRSSADTPSRDFGYSFARDESAVDYFGEMIDGFAVGLLPSYRAVEDTLYLCRPITNIFALPRIEESFPDMDAAIDQCWQETAARLTRYSKDGELDLERYNIENTFPGKNKIRPDVLAAVQQKTTKLLDLV